MIVQLVIRVIRLQMVWYVLLQHLVHTLNNVCLIRKEMLSEQ